MFVKMLMPPIPAMLSGPLCCHKTAGYLQVENAAYPLTMCADRAAVFHAVSEGIRAFDAIAIATEDGGAPCGSCRQVLSEFGMDIQVILVNERGETVDQMTVAELLPKSFSSDNLNS